MDKKASILCVDDEPINLAILEELLQSDYALNSVNSGESCLQQVGIKRPDLILLDVNMPEMDGLETCERLKADTDTAEIPVIFVSALATQEELMAGYEAGGDDYITKPFSEEILQKKVELVLASQLRKRELENISEQAVEALKRNLTNTEKLEMVVGFLHRCQRASDLDELADNVFDCLREFDLDSSLLIEADGENRVWFSDGINRPMEGQILQSLRGQDRVLSFGTRVAVNSDRTTLLVRNLPSDPEEIERLRQHLVIMIEGLDTRLQAMQTQMQVNARREGLTRVLEAAHEKLCRIEKQHQRQALSANETMTALGKELERSLLGLDLTKRQERALLEIIDASASRIRSLCDEDRKLDDEFEAIIDDLSGTLEE
ncbi:MAG: response regulator [Gammaproteobacteria bacterium]|nr:response regulator [Gammaproteobacteria bacterium]MDH3859489.1 response regulator [Gammaproteobacteria bacterium]